MPQDVDPTNRIVLQELRKKNILLAVGLSNKNAPFILKKTNLRSYFNVIVDGTMISHSKPNPEVFLLIASLLKVSPNSSIVVEDAFAGIEAAKNGGFITAGIGPASHDEEADYHLRSLQDLLSISD